MGNENTANTKNFIFFILIVVILLGGYQFIIRKEVNKQGVYLKCTIVSSEGYKGGIMTNVGYKYRGKEYQVRVHSEWGREKVGDAYFIKVLPSNPEAIVFLENNPVPDCLANIDSPTEGWKELPKCE